MEETFYFWRAPLAAGRRSTPSLSIVLLSFPEAYGALLAISVSSRALSSVCARGAAGGDYNRAGKAPWDVTGAIATESVACSHFSSCDATYAFFCAARVRVARSLRQLRGEESA